MALRHYSELEPLVHHAQEYLHSLIPATAQGSDRKR